jgi:hypothetical protein
LREILETSLSLRAGDLGRRKLVRQQLGARG